MSVMVGDADLVKSADKRGAMADGIRAVVQEPTTGDIVAAFASQDD